MSKVLWVLTIFVSYVCDTFALPPEVPQTPSWDNLSIEKPRSSVIPTWYDVLVTPRVTKEIESKNITGVSYAELSKSLALNQLNLPEVIKKDVVLEAEEIDIANANSKNITKKAGTKMKDLYKNRFQKTKKEMKAELINSYLIPKMVITESPKTNKKQKEYFPKEEKKPLPPLNSSVPLYVPIFRPQTNSKKQNTQRMFEKPEFVKLSPNNQETLQNDLQKQTVIAQSKDNNNIKFVPAAVENKPVVKEDNEESINENRKPHEIVLESSEENNLINKVIQAIKDGELKLDEGQLKLKMEENLPNLFEEKETSDQQNNVKTLTSSDVPIDFMQTYQQLDKSNTPPFVIKQPVNHYSMKPFKPIVVEIINPERIKPQILNQQPINAIQQPVIKQNNQEFGSQLAVNQKQFNPEATYMLPVDQQSTINQQQSDQLLLNQLLLNQQPLSQQSFSIQPCFKQQDRQQLNQQTFIQQLINHQELNHRPMNQPFLNQQSDNQKILNQESLSPQQIVELINQQLMNQQKTSQSLNQQQINELILNDNLMTEQSFQSKSLSQQYSNQQPMNQKSMHQKCVNQDSFSQQQIIELLSQLKLNDSPEKISRESMSCLNPEMKSSETFRCPNNDNVNSQNILNVSQKRNKNQNTYKPDEITQKNDNNNPVVTIFKPDTVSLWETNGNFLKKRTMTVLVPVHAEKLIT